MRINFPLRPMGKPWLFDDLRRHLCREGEALGHECIPSKTPVDADAWVVLRTQEAGSTPNPARTVGMVHDLYDADYGPGEPRAGIADCGGLVLTHPGQRQIIFRNIGNHALLAPQVCRPIGASRQFFEVERQPAETFTIGWVGRPISYRGRDIKRLDRLVEAARLLGPPLRALLVGSNLAAVADELLAAGARVEFHERAARAEPWETWAPALYARMDALLITSEIEAGPMCLFEALAAGVPVVTTPCGWARVWAEGRRGGIIPGAWVAHNPEDEELSSRLDWIRHNGGAPCEVVDAAKVVPALESWCREVIELAVEVAGA